MNGKKAKKLKKEWLELNQNPKYNIKGQIVEGISFRQYKQRFVIYAGNNPQAVSKDIT